MPLTRRHLLAGAAGAAAGAAMPAAAVAKPKAMSVADIFGSEYRMLSRPEYLAALEAPGWAITVPDYETGHFYNAGEVVNIDGVQHRVMTPHYTDDPVRHPEGRDDPTEYA